jgi:cytochrome P450
VGDISLPAGTTVAILSGWLHRDSAHYEAADRYDPRAWLDGRAGQNEALVPFSAGPARCPGEDVVSLTAGSALQVLGRTSWQLTSHDLTKRERLPATFDHYRIRVSRVPGAD